MSFQSPVAAAEPLLIRGPIDWGLITGVRNIDDWVRKSDGLLVEFDAVSLDPDWPPGPTGKLVAQWQRMLDGRCVRAVLNVGIKRFALARARAYYIIAKKPNQLDWYLLGDPLVANIIRRNLLHDKLIAGRVIACHLEGYTVDRIVWAAGPHAAKAKALGMRELERSAILGAAPVALLRFAAQSLRTSGGLAVETGLFCFDEADLPKLTKMAGEVSAGTLTLRGAGNEIIGHADCTASPNWSTNLTFSQALLQEKERNQKLEDQRVLPFSTGRSKT